MYYKVLISLLLAMVSIAASGREVADTVKVIESPESVVVTQSGTTTTIKAVFRKDSLIQETYRYEVNVKNQNVEPTDSFPDNWGMDFPFMHSEKKDKHGKKYLEKNLTCARHLYWGWRFNYGDKGNLKNCFEVGIRDLIGVTWRRGGSELEIGLGYGMKRFLADDGYRYAKSGDNILLTPLAENVEMGMSRLDILTLHVPVLYNQMIGRDVKISIGGSLNFNTYAAAFTKTRMGNLKIQETSKGLHQNFFTPEIIAGIYINDIGIYSSWSPMEQFKKPYGPSVKGWSLGIDLFF